MPQPQFHEQFKNLLPTNFLDIAIVLKISKNLQLFIGVQVIINLNGYLSAKNTKLQRDTQDSLLLNFGAKQQSNQEHI